MMIRLGTKICAVALVLAAGAAQAQSSASSVAANMQSWRDACGDPNPDLALGYLIEAVATNSIDVRKACLRQVLASDNVDLRSSALRVIIASLPVIRFRLKEPDAAAKMSNNDTWLQQSIVTGLVFRAANGSAETGTATWYPLIAKPEPDEELKGTVTVLGSGVIWAGRVQYSNIRDDCKLVAELGADTLLEGHFQCGIGNTFPVFANLLD
ncbi:MAG: hypothetical protein WBC90_15000 [Albidovulum sp.]